MTVMPLPAFPRLANLSDDELGLVTVMNNRLTLHQGPNNEAESFYDGTHVAQNFGISTPPRMSHLRTVAGWGGTVVDVLEERLDWLGWTSELDDFGLDEVYAENQLDVDSGMAHLDALIFGISFVTVGAGYDGEPSPLITPHSPKSLTVQWDRRTRRASAALAVVEENGRTVEATLYLPHETVVVGYHGGTWSVLERDRHNLGRVPVVAIPNRVRGSRELGRSEITRAVRYYTEAACRTLLGLEVNREFYNAPQRIGLNINDEDFEDENGNPVSPWTSIMGRVWNVPPNDEGLPEPKVLQFDPSSPAPYIDQVKGYATLLAAEAGIPPTYLGFETGNPASADAIRAGEARLVKRAERRQVAFGRAWLEVGRLALLVRDGAVPDSFSSLGTRWRDAATPTRAAAADEALKLTSGDNPILPPNSSVTYDRIGLSPAEQRQVEIDRRRMQGRSILDQIAARSGDTERG